MKYLDILNQKHHCNPANQGRKDGSMKKIFCLIAAVLFCVCSNNKIAGTIDETDTGITGKVHFWDGTDAADVSVKVFLDTAIIPLDGTLTDVNGSFSIVKLSPGSYSIWAQGGDSLGAFMDSIQVFHSKKTAADLTLEKCGSIIGFVGLQPQHDPQSVTVQALGTQKVSNVSVDGEFRLSGLAPGEYSIRLASTIAGYTPTYATISVPSGKTDTLKDVFILIYTDIPVVMNPRAAYDTPNGIVRVTWDSTDYRNFREYLIYRDPANALQPSLSPFAAVTEHFYNDPLSIDGDYTYRIAIRSNDLQVGPTFFGARVTVYSPQHIYSIFSENSLRTPLNMPCTLRLNIDPWFGNDPKLMWTIGPKASMLDSSAVSPIIFFHDTMTPDYPCIVSIKGQEGKTASDTIHLQSWLAWEKIAEPPMSDGEGFKSIVFNGVIFAFIGEPRKEMITKLKWLEWTSSDGISWQKVSDSLPFGEWTSNPVVFKDKMLVADNQNNIWGSTNGASWNFIERIIPDSTKQPYPWYSDTIITHTYLWGDSNKMWYIEEYSYMAGMAQKYYASLDGTEWFYEIGSFDLHSEPVNFLWCATMTINDIFWILSDEYGWIIKTGSSPVSLNKKESPTTLSSFLDFAAIQFHNCIFLAGFTGKDVLYSRDLGSTWSKCDDNYPSPSPLVNGGGATKSHSCCVFAEHIYSMSKTGVWRTK